MAKAVRIIDNARFELRCKCGANGVYSIAVAYADRAGTCRTCRRRTELGADDMQTIDDHISRVIAEIERGAKGQ